MQEVSQKYYRYEEMVEYLRSAEKEYPDLVELTSAGKSYEGRDLVVAILTQKKTGSHDKKPAIYIDGNHHAGEVTGSAVCLYTIEYLLSNYGKNGEITGLLDTKTFYILPRVSPDGAELYLTGPYMLRSSVRPYPDEDLGEGLVPGDVNGDGKILQMRWEDPAGAWKTSEKDPRAMVRRKPGDVGGKYYRMVTEGYLRDFDGVEIKAAKPKWGLDLNRNYPGSWHASNQQTGPGPYPLSEPETRAVADFFRAHPNIAMALSYHTSGGFILRPRTGGPDRDMNQADLRILKTIGRKGTEITGYPCVSIFEGFTADQKRPSTGSFMDFTYDVLGIAAYAVELWDLSGRAKIPKRDLKQMIEMTEDQEEEDQVKILGFVDKELAGEGFYDWIEFDHPQLGKVEIGGFDPKFLRQNPPPKLLTQECHKNCLFSLMLAETLPSLQVFDLKCAKIGEGEYELTLVLRNTGFLDTCSMQQSLTTKATKPVKLKARLRDRVTLIAGKQYEEIGHLQGWGNGRNGYGLEKKVRYVFKTAQSFSDSKLCDLTIESERAGTIHIEVNLPE